MDKLISSGYNFQSVPESYVLPPESRPGKFVDPSIDAIPIIDFAELSHIRTTLIQQIIKACQEFGFFQLIDHGVSERLMEEAMGVAKEFFELPASDKASLYSEDMKQISCRLFTSIDYANEKVHYWRDSLRFTCHPDLEEHMLSWPERPVRYREVIGNYAVEAKKLCVQILDLICEGLGLEKEYMMNGPSKVHVMLLNHYPPCPDPSLTLGLPKHGDSGLITLLLQEPHSYGLQVLKDGDWLALKPLPNAFVVNIGYILQIISNGKLKSAQHRVVTNKNDARTTIASFINPSNDAIIKPVDCNNPPLFKPFTFQDFYATFMADARDRVPPLESYKLHQ